MAKATTLDDIAESISDLTQMMAGEFQAVRKEMADGFTEVHKNQRETNARLEKLEGDFKAVEDDVKGLYFMIKDMRKNSKNFTVKDYERLNELEAFALQVAEKTGIPYNPKPKRRS